MATDKKGRIVSLQFTTEDGVKLKPVEFPVYDGESIKGDQGDSAYEVWRQEPGNANKTKDDYYKFLQASVEIQQKTGTSTTAVMSQKATTDALNLKVGVTRTINGYPLGNDIILGAADLDAYTKSQTDLLLDEKQAGINKAQAQADKGVRDAVDAKADAKAANDNANTRVPNTRKVNGKALSADIELTPNDIYKNRIGLGTEDLNTIVATGIYGQGYASNGLKTKNYPLDGFAGIIEVFQLFAGDGKTENIKQVAKMYHSNLEWSRTRNSNTWSTWSANYSEANKPTPAALGMYNNSQIDSKVATAIPKTAIVQVEGDSETNVPSQKAVKAQVATRVPTTRKVNNKPLTADITLTPEDVGTYTKQEIDSKLSSNTGAAVAKTDVVQTTGSSKTQIMSQNATTSQLATKIDKLAINNQSIKSELEVKDRLDVAVGAYNDGTNNGLVRIFCLNDGRMGIGTRGKDSKWTGDLILPQTGNGTIAKKEDHYTKTESDAKYPAKGDDGFHGGPSKVSFNFSSKEEFLNYVRASSRPSQIFRLDSPSVVAGVPSRPYAPSLLLKTNDTWATLSIPYAGQRVYIQSGNNSGSTLSDVHVLAWYDDVDGRVPKTCTVNSKPLTTDITLGAADVGAYSKTESDNKYSPKVKRYDVNSGSLDNLLEEGIYRISSPGTTVVNFPTYPDGSRLYGYGILEVIVEQGVVMQRYTAHSGDNPGVQAQRVKWSGGSQFSPWKVSQPYIEKAYGDANTVYQMFLSELSAARHGEDSVADEYMVLCRNVKAGTNYPVQGMMGQITLNRGGPSYGSVLGMYNITAITAYQSTHVLITALTPMPNPEFGRLYRATLAGEEWIVVKLRGVGGRLTNGAFFNGMLYGSTETNSQRFKVVRESTLTNIQPYGDSVQLKERTVKVPVTSVTDKVRTGTWTSFPVRVTINGLEQPKEISWNYDSTTDEIWFGENVTTTDEIYFTYK